MGVPPVRVRLKPRRHERDAHATKRTISRSVRRLLLCPAVPIRITNATAMYAIMLLVFACGMWAILVYGSTLQAQPDLAGEWELSPEGRGTQEPLRANIEQSGRYLRMKFADRTLDMRITASRPTIEMKGDGVTMRFDPSPSPNVFRVTIESPNDGRRVYSGRIVTRTYPHAPIAREPQKTNLAPAQSGPAPAAAVTRPSTHAH